MKFATLKTAHLRLGRRGENKVCEFLRSKGAIIIERNFRRLKDEIDIIALDGRNICFVEVKTRKAPLKTRPAWGLDDRQRKRIRRAAMHYLAEIGNPILPYRFDLAEVVFSRLDVIEFRYWQNNFTESCSFHTNQQNL